VDLDRFKMVNDTAGHAAGDTILKMIATALKSAVHARDVVGRLGGDEFAVLLLDCDRENAERIGQRILRLISDCRVASNGKTHEVGASIGLSVVDNGQESAQTVMAQADVACYAAKTSGRNRISVFTPDAGEAPRHLSDIRVAAGIRDAIQQNSFRLYAQEIRDLRSPLKACSRYEILTRMIGADGSVVLPGAFIPAAERFDLMGELDRWVIRTTIGEFGARIMADPARSVAINLSANSLNDPDLWPFVSTTLAAGCLAPARLTFEITETAVINNFVAAERFVENARQLGCRISLDDFGAGVSSFSYLKRFPADSIKIDQGFVRAMHESRYDRLIVRLIGDIARDLGAEVIAEGIERPETVEALRSIGIEIGQGFLFHRPRPLAEIVGEDRQIAPGRRAAALSR
jgi:diguanylate cyclase (GGDEF)-like protein